MSQPRCPLCGKATSQLLALTSDFHLKKGHRYAVWLCPTCDLGVTATTLGHEGIPISMYGDAYQPHRAVSRAATGWRKRLTATALTGWGYPQPDALPLPAIIQRGFAHLRGWTWMPPPPPSGRLLDVGCGSGAYAVSLRRLGWQVEGVEPNARAARLARQEGVSVYQSRIEDVDLSGKRYDAITLWHSLEHLAAPVPVLRKLRSALNSNGLLIVETPNFRGWGAKLMGEFWYHWDLPRHQLHFSPKSLRRALELGGFRLIQMAHIPNPYGFTGGVAYRLHNVRFAKSAVLCSAGWLFGWIAALFHHGDVIRAIAVPLKEDSPAEAAVRQE